jgi:hypothetical protein
MYEPLQARIAIASSNRSGALLCVAELTPVLRWDALIRHDQHLHGRRRGKPLPEQQEVARDVDARDHKFPTAACAHHGDALLARAVRVRRDDELLVVHTPPEEDELRLDLEI